MQETIKSTAVEMVQHFIGKDNSILRLEVRNKWLVASLASGVHFWVLNE